MQRILLTRSYPFPAAPLVKAQLATQKVATAKGKKKAVKAPEYVLSMS